MSGEVAVKGWCPGAFRPMMSGDGLIVRLRPFLARLSAAQVLGLCDAAEKYGNGIIDLTNRANLQIRGVSEAGHRPLLQALDTLGVLDPSPDIEARRNILLSPFWQPGDATHEITQRLLRALPDFPELPAKFGFAVDTAEHPLLRGASADIRVERAVEGFVVRADGAERGRPARVADIPQVVAALAHWFVQHRHADDRRMARLVDRGALPEAWATTAPLAAKTPPVPGVHPMGALAGVAFGQMEAARLARLISASGAGAMRVTPWRMILLEGGVPVDDDAFLWDPASPLLNAHACPGAPFCTSATVDTRHVARQLAARIGGSLHVSGCAKGCALKQPADVTLIGQAGRFDLVRYGHAWDAPEKHGLQPEDVLANLKNLA